MGLLTGAALLCAGPVAAQYAGYQEDAGSALTRHLRSLSDDPRNLYALMGAAQAALKLGDPQAAVTFYARAEEVAPRDPRIKAGMGAAFVQMEQARSALKFFGDASALGIADGAIAGDRGLAYDLIGDNQRAQRDYRLALQIRNDPEIERRLALSLAISGDKEGALATIDGQLRRQDRAAWRTRAFVLALTGDAAGATQAVQAAMPGQAAAMQPFLARLPSLDLASRAMAVHFGHFPSGSRPYASAQGTQLASLAPVASSQAGRPDTGQPALGGGASTRSGTAPATAQRETTPRRRPDTEERSARVETAERAPRRSRRELGVPLGAPSPEESRRRREEAARLAARPVRATPPAASRSASAIAPIPAPVQARPQPPAETRQPPQPQANVPIARESSPPAVSPSAYAALPQPSPPAFAPATTPPREVYGPPASDQEVQAPAAGRTIETVALPQSTIAAPAAPAEANSTADDSPEATPAAAPPTATSPPASRRPLAFAEVVEAIKALPGETEGSKPATASEPAPPEAAAAPAQETSEAGPAAVSAAESRHWVQIASAPDSLVTSEYRRLKAKHPKLLGDKDGYRTPFGRSNRVMVGPFPTADEARAFVGQLKKSSLTAIAWTSPQGQEIDKINGK